MKIAGLVFCTTVLFSGGSGLTISGKCPDIKPDGGFVFEKWLKGIWFKVYHDIEDVHDLQREHKCLKKEFTYYPESNILVAESYAVHKSHHVPLRYTRYGDVTDKSGQFTFHVFGKSTKNIDFIDVRVVHTDNESYGCIYSCAKANVENISYVSVWFASRSRNLPQGVIKDASRLFLKHGLNLTFTRVERRDCRARCDD